MYSEQQLVTVDPTLWAEIGERAAAESVSVDAWLRQRVTASNETAHSDDRSDAILLELTQRHFRDLALSADEYLRLGSALSDTIEDGTAHEVGPIGRQGRRYHLHRRTGRVRIRVGEAAVTLPLVQATRLATWLNASERLRDVAAIAA